MAMYRQNLPQLSGKTFITDGGMETVLIFQEQIDLPEFASYDLLRNQQGYETLFNYYEIYAKLAKQYQVGIVLETPTWRANPDWGKKIGDSPEILEQMNRESVKLVEHIRKEYGDEDSPIVISGCIGPRGDGYTPSALMTVEEAKDYHTVQIATFADTNADMVAALTFNYVEEAIGLTLAAQEHDIPACISFTLETDGKLPNGLTLEEAIHRVDEATDNGPVYYMINCAHPTHFAHLFENNSGTLSRVRGLRGNASCLSHAELDECETLDEGNPVQFGTEIVSLQSASPHLTVLGGCCGTDHRHIEHICQNLG